MVLITGKYLGDLRCEATHTPSGNQLITDAPVDNQGKGEAFSPTDLAATATMTCMATILGIKAQSMGIDLKGMTMSVTKEMAAAPRRIKKLSLVFNIPAQADEAQRTSMERAAAACPVHQSLHPEVEQVVSYNWGTKETQAS